MSNFNWLAFLNRYHVAYNTRGPNTPNGCVTVACPFCGHADPSDHMVIWASGRWSCWRNHSHRGSHPAKLVQVLIRCTTLEAERITSSAAKPLGSTDLGKVAAVLAPPPRPPSRELKMPDHFRPMSNGWACQAYIAYLRGRGINANAAYLHWRYGLRYCTHGPFKGRIIFPITYAGKLISWTGRTIYPAEKQRYKSLTTNADVAERMGLEPAIGPVNSYLLWYDWLAKNENAHTLVVVEGPLDALNINTLAEPTIVATCWTGSQPTPAQIDLVRTLSKHYSRRIIISDRDMTERADKIAGQLKALDFKVAVLPHGVHDPAEIHSNKQLAAILAC